MMRSPGRLLAAAVLLGALACSSAIQPSDRKPFRCSKAATVVGRRGWARSPSRRRGRRQWRPPPACPHAPSCRLASVTDAFEPAYARTVAGSCKLTSPPTSCCPFFLPARPTHHTQRLSERCHEISFSFESETTLRGNEAEADTYGRRLCPKQLGNAWQYVTTSQTILDDRQLIRTVYCRRCDLPSGSILMWQVGRGDGTAVGSAGLRFCSVRPGMLPEVYASCPIPHLLQVWLGSFLLRQVLLMGVHAIHACPACDFLCLVP